MPPLLRRRVPQARRNLIAMKPQPNFAQVQSCCDPYLSTLSWRTVADKTKSIYYFTIENLTNSKAHAIIRSIKRPFVLVTSSERDMWVPHNAFQQRILQRNPFLVKWYTKNPGVRHHKLEPLPIGPKWLQNWSNMPVQLSLKLPMYRSVMPNVQAANDKFRDVNKQKSELLFVKFSVLTTKDPCFKQHRGERVRALAAMQRNFPGVDNSSVPPERYWTLLAKHKFALSPPGNGLDCHRTWEALMVGTIPVVLETPLAPKLYEGLPVVIVKSWDVVTKSFLEQKYVHLHDMAVGDYQWNRLVMDFWKTRIRQTNFTT